MAGVYQGHEALDFRTSYPTMCVIPKTMLVLPEPVYKYYIPDAS
jgi:hypothetical protein